MVPHFGFAEITAEKHKKIIFSGSAVRSPDRQRI
jgi:hypothetical protein